MEACTVLAQLPAQLATQSWPTEACFSAGAEEPGLAAYACHLDLDSPLAKVRCPASKALKRANGATAFAKPAQAEPSLAVAAMRSDSAERLAARKRSSSAG